MIKRILFILFLSVSSLGFSQEKLISQLSASPNPFEVSTKIHFTATESGTVLFKVKNVLGKTVHFKELQILKGENTFFFFKGDLSAGMYIYSIQNKKNIVSKRLVIQ